jgi:hypothetical protein
MLSLSLVLIGLGLLSHRVRVTDLLWVNCLKLISQSSMVKTQSYGNPIVKVTFDMYSVESLVWVHVATMHFDGLAARWLQSVHHSNCYME